MRWERVRRWYLVSLEKLDERSAALSEGLPGYGDDLSLQRHVFDERGPRWAWHLLARPTPKPRPISNVTDANKNQTTRLSMIEQLPVEVLDIIMKEACLRKTDFLTFGLSSPVLWQSFLDYMHDQCMSASAYWAGKPFACAYTLINDIPILTDNLRELMESRHSFGPLANYAKEAHEWRYLAADRLTTPHDEDATSVGTAPAKTNAYPPEPMKAPLYASLLANLPTIETQTWDQPWILRNQTKRLFVTLDPVDVKFKQSRPSIPDSYMLASDPPRLYIQHDGIGSRPGASKCSCSISVEDLLFYHILWGPPWDWVPAWADSGIYQAQPGQPNPQGEWAGDSFDIVAQDVHQGASSDTEWQDQTDRMRAFFAGLVECDLGQGSGDPLWQLKAYC